MPRKPNPPPDDAEQAARFIETAKLLESDKTGETFNDALSTILSPETPTVEKPIK